MPANQPDPQFAMLTEAILFLVRHVPVPNLADAFIADLTRVAGHDEQKLKVIENWAYQLRERDEFIADNDA